MSPSVIVGGETNQNLLPFSCKWRPKERRGLMRDRVAPSFLSSGLRCPIQAAKEPSHFSRCLKVFVEDLSFSEICYRDGGSGRRQRFQGQCWLCHLKGCQSLCLYQDEAEGDGRGMGRRGGGGRKRGGLQPVPTCLLFPHVYAPSMHLPVPGGPRPEPQSGAQHPCPSHPSENPPRQGAVKG